MTGLNVRGGTTKSLTGDGVLTVTSEAADLRRGS